MALCATLHISRAAAIGHLHLLWYWALDNAPDGDLSGISPEILAEVSGFLDGRSHRFGTRLVSVCSSFATCLVSTGWIDTDGKLHDWDDYAGKLIRAREVDRIRHRKSVGTPTEIRQNSKATVPNPTVPNSTIPPLIPLKGVKSPTEKTTGKENGKRPYGEGGNCLLKETEYQELITRFGAADATARIDRLSTYVGANGKKYKSHYMAILSWAHNEKQEVTHGINPHRPRPLPATYTDPETGKQWRPNIDPSGD